MNMGIDLMHSEIKIPLLDNTELEYASKQQMVIHIESN